MTSHVVAFAFALTILFVSAAAARPASSPAVSPTRSFASPGGAPIPLPKRGASAAAASTGAGPAGDMSPAASSQDVAPGDTPPEGGASALKLSATAVGAATAAAAGFLIF
ncbi:hypothetical protein AAHA92_31720 [Salvia divinorum]|uniref:Arabinogalactan-protein n=1 Tax=Salvia divinorum TaxID=28513 RepID=A0ABD1FIC2_SALDI